jgi:hypothetical protein
MTPLIERNTTVLECTRCDFHFILLLVSYPYSCPPTPILYTLHHPIPCYGTRVKTRTQRYSWVRGYGYVMAMGMGRGLDACG